MAAFIPIDKIRERVGQDRTDSDVALFYSLLFYGEFLTKLVVLGVAAGIGEDRDRHRYSIHHQLVRADGLGTWCTALDQCLTGPASHHLCPALRETQRQLTQRVPREHWSYRAVESIKSVLDMMSIDCDALADRAALRQWFLLFSALRNKT